MGPVDQALESLGAAFLGMAFEAGNGSAAWTEGKSMAMCVHVFSMYETSFQVVALRASGIQNLAQLSGRRVGVGPAGGPTESFFKGLA